MLLFLYLFSFKLEFTFCVYSERKSYTVVIKKEDEEERRKKIQSSEKIPIDGLSLDLTMLIVIV